MLNRSEIKDIILNKIIFPDFSNKVTWFVIGIGSTILLSQGPLKLFVYNWFIDNFNLNSGQNFTLAELQSDTADYWIGFALIFLALIHNIGYKIFLYISNNTKKVENEEVIKVDKVLYKEFVELLPSDGSSMSLLREHDFGHSYHNNSIKDLNTFIHTWDKAEKQFLNEELEVIRSDFLEKLSIFYTTLASRSYHIGGQTFSCIPDAYRGAWEWPKHVNEQIAELNELASDCFQIHKQLVLTARKRLKC